MQLPGLPGNFFQERAGVQAVSAEVLRLGLIWRETSLADVGIDGHIEFVNDSGHPTGQLIAVQIKSGPSYFHDHDDVWWYYPDEKHRTYWERYPLPVIVMLHSPADGVTYWLDARFALRSPLSGAKKHLVIPKANRLQSATREQLFSSIGASGTKVQSIKHVLATMAFRHSGEGGMPVTYLDLFVHGLVNIGRSLYYGMALVTDVAQIKLEMYESEFGMGMGGEEHDFLWSYVCFLVEQHLADVNMSDALIDWIDRQIHPQFIAPLTSRGRQLVQSISKLQDHYAKLGRLEAPDGIRVAQEGLLQPLIVGSHLLRFPVIEQFHAQIREDLTPKKETPPSPSDAGEAEKQAEDASSADEKAE